MNIIPLAPRLQKLDPNQSRSVGKKIGCATPDVDSVDRWPALNQLKQYRRALGLTYSELSTVEALLRCIKRGLLTKGKAYRIQASNRKLQALAGRMPRSTFSRTLQRLEKKKLIIRHVGGSGKRQLSCTSSPYDLGASFIDISPMVEWFISVPQKIEAIRQEDKLQKELRSAIKCLRSEIRYLLDQLNDLDKPGVMDVAQRFCGDYSLPRKADSRVLQNILAQETKDRDVLVLNMGSSRAHFEVPIHKSESEVISITSSLGVDGFEEVPTEQGNASVSMPSQRPIEPEVVVRLCPELKAHFEGFRVDERTLFQVANIIRQYFTVPDGLWETAIEKAGAMAAILAVAIVLRRQETVEKHGAYLARILRDVSGDAYAAQRLFRTLVRYGEPA